MRESGLKSIFALFIRFLKIGLLTFGGGYAMISFIHEEIVEKSRWLDDDEMMNIIVIAESTPGVLAVNTATFTGYKIAGILGAVAATFGVVLPSFVIICVVSLFIEQFKNLKYIAYALSGIRAGVVVLILNAVKKLDKKNIHNLFYFFVLGTTLILSLFFKVGAIYIILISAVFGIFYTYVLAKKLKPTDDEPKEGDDKS